MIDRELDFSILKGKEIKSIKGLIKGDSKIVLNCSDGSIYEVSVGGVSPSAYITKIRGKAQRICRTPILAVCAFDDINNKTEEPTSCLYNYLSFIHISTVYGYVDIYWDVCADAEEEPRRLELRRLSEPEFYNNLKDILVDTFAVGNEAFAIRSEPKTNVCDKCHGDSVKQQTCAYCGMTGQTTYHTYSVHSFIIESIKGEFDVDKDDELHINRNLSLIDRDGNVYKSNETYKERKDAERRRLQLTREEKEQIEQYKKMPYNPTKYSIISFRQGDGNE